MCVCVYVCIYKDTFEKISCLKNGYESILVLGG